MTRYFWTLFFLGSLFAVAIDVSERRQTVPTSEKLEEVQSLGGDPFGQPTPNP